MQKQLFKFSHHTSYEKGCPMGFSLQRKYWLQWNSNRIPYLENDTIQLAQSEGTLHGTFYRNIESPNNTVIRFDHKTIKESYIKLEKVIPNFVFVQGKMSTISGNSSEQCHASKTYNGIIYLLVSQILELNF
jgi:hypothetical protein